MLVMCSQECCSRFSVKWAIRVLCATKINHRYRYKECFNRLWPTDYDLFINCFHDFFECLFICRDMCWVQFLTISQCPEVKYTIIH